MKKLVFFCIPSVRGAASAKITGTEGGTDKYSFPTNEEENPVIINLSGWSGT